jgi:hypothetical protein
MVKLDGFLIIRYRLKNYQPIVKELVGGGNKMLEWLFVQNDPLASARISILETMVVFVLGALILSWSLFYLLRRVYSIERLNKFALTVGYNEWESLRFFFVRDVTFYASMFLMAVIMIYTFTHMVEVKNIYFYGALPDMARQCKEQGGYFTCSKNVFNNISDGLGFWNGSAIINQSYSHQ